MATITINLTDEQKNFLNNYAKERNMNITDLFIVNNNSATKNY